MDILSILIIIGLFKFSLLDYEENWRSYPTCKIGRLQSPIEIKEYESIYANNFSFIYQSYIPITFSKDCNQNNYACILKTTTNGGYINFERGGVIKQYQFKSAELYKGLHKVDGEKGEYELHLIHEKNLDFITNKNQYRSIQDANMYLVIVLRYSKCGDNKVCTSDNNLLKNILEGSSINLNNYSVFQDKRAYFYEGSFVHIPCDENVNYYVVKDLFFLNIDENSKLNDFPSDSANIKAANTFGRPVYKNFMNYREVLGNDYFSFKKYYTLFLLMIVIL